MKIVVLDGYCLNPGDLSWDALREFGEVEVFDRTRVDEVAGARRGGRHRAHQQDAACRDTLARNCRELRYIGVLATGYDVVDVEAARERGIVVTNIPTYGTASVAQFVFALLLELCHNVKLHADAVRAGEWARNPDWSFWKSPLVGAGRQDHGDRRLRPHRAADRAASPTPWGCGSSPTIPTTATSPAVPGFRWASVEEVLRESDVVSLHSPLFPETRGMINAGSLALMKPSAFLINTSRGPLVVDRDLADALNAGRLAGAGLDVLSVEPPDRDTIRCSRPATAWSRRTSRGPPGRRGRG